MKEKISIIHLNHIIYSKLLEMPLQRLYEVQIRILLMVIRSLKQVKLRNVVSRHLLMFLLNFDNTSNIVIN